MWTLFWTYLPKILLNHTQLSFEPRHAYLLYFICIWPLNLFIISSKDMFQIFQSLTKSGKYLENCHNLGLLRTSSALSSVATTLKILLLFDVHFNFMFCFCLSYIKNNLMLSVWALQELMKQNLNLTFGRMKCYQPWYSVCQQNTCKDIFVVDDLGL